MRIASIAVFVFATVFLVLPCTVSASTVTGKHCTVSYAKIAPEYAQAIANVIDTAYGYYKGTLSMQLPKQIFVTINDNSYATRLWTDGRKQITLDLADRADLHPNNGYFHIYGMCEQLGAISMLSKLGNQSGLPDGVLVGWKRYLGSLAVDEVWTQYGADAWPVPYDYITNGTSRLLSQCAKDQSDPSTLAACTFLAIGDKYTHKKVGMAMKSTLSSEPDGDELMGRFAKTLDSRAGKGASKMIPDSVRKTVITQSAPITMLPGRGSGIGKSWTDEDGWMGYDDDSHDGMRSIAGSGHAVSFHVKGGGKLTAVQVKGGRYGKPHSDSTYQVTVLDPNQEIVQSWDFPFMKFSMRTDNLYWVEMSTGGVKVPAHFTVVFTFNPAQTDGVYVGFDADAGGHSSTGLPGSNMREFGKGEWMIRVLVE